MCDFSDPNITCFDTTPSWWTSLANLTDWLNWDAVGAVSTTLALLMTIRLATEARRERHQREAVLLGTAAHILRAAFLSIRSSIEGFTPTDEWEDSHRDYLFRRLKEDNVGSRLDAIAPSQFPTVQTAENYQAALLAITNIEDERNNPGADWYKVVTENHTQLDLNIRKLEGAAFRRSHSVIGRIVRQTWKGAHR